MEQNPLTRERESYYRIRLTKILEEEAKKNASDYDLMSCCHDEDLHGSPSPSNITLVLILSAIFIILLISALLTCSKQRKQSQVDI